MSRLRVALAVAGAAIGVAAGLAVGLTRDDGYEATAVLQVLPAPEGSGDLRPAQVQAATYASLVEQRAFLQQVRAQVAAGQLTVDELADRVDGRHEAGTALVEVAARGDTDLDARALAADLAGALLASVQQSERTRALQAEDEVRRRIAVLDGDIAAAEGDPARQESLREQRQALAQELAELTQAGLIVAGRLVLAAPAAEAHRVGSAWWPWPLAGAAIGLLLGLVPVPRRRPVRAPEARIVAPEPGGFVRGTPAVTTEPPGQPVEWSADGRTWVALGDEPLADGRYLLRAQGARQATPVVVDTTPPAVVLAPPRLEAGVVRLEAEAEDAGSGVAAIAYLVSTGGPDWAEVPADYEPDQRGVHWFCAVATDRAGNKASSELLPLNL